MICYRDATFCPYYKICKDGKECSRALTREMLSYAKSAGLPICQFVEKPDCFKQRDKK